MRQRRGKFGTRLLTKLAGIFALVGLLPGLVIYTVSYQFVSRSIEIWFDVKVATALDAGLALGKGTLQSLVDELGTKTRQAAERLGDERIAVTPLSLERLREQLDVRDLALLGANGQILISAGGSSAAMAPERPGAEALREARCGPRVQPDRGPGRGAAGRQARLRARACVRWRWCATPRSRSSPARSASCWRCSRCRRSWPPMRWRCRRPTANTSSARWRATRCAACTSAR